MLPNVLSSALLKRANTAADNARTLRAMIVDDLENNRPVASNAAAHDKHKLRERWYSFAAEYEGALSDLALELYEQAELVGDELEADAIRIVARFIVRRCRLLTATA